MYYITKNDISQGESGGKAEEKMTRLSNSEIQKWFAKEFPEIPEDFLPIMEKVETWTKGKDGSRLLVDLERLVEVLDLPKEQILLSGERTVLVTKEDLESLVYLLSYCKSGMSLRLMEVLNRHQNGLGGDLLLEAKENLANNNGMAAANVLLARFKQLVHVDLFHKLFGKETRQEVLSTLRAMEEV